MNELATHPDIAVPSRNVPCVDHELVHPRNVRRYMIQYSQLLGRSIATPSELIEAFFELNQKFGYAGFKSMPDRHPDLSSFGSRTDIRFVTLTRRDIASTVASFLVALRTGTWRRSGEAPPASWRFVPSRDAGQATGNLSYVLESEERLRRMPDAVRLTYEELCDPRFRSAPLEDFFGRPVHLSNPRPPTSGESYVENWPEFREFIERSARRLTNTAGA
ncbi:MAG TPA: hypothetical protein VEN81_10135 [Planctomycetota bacterium]|nr:hypothetical protein [Planctomycetota bacterium]